MINYRELSPIEKHGEIWFKREDLFKPFLDFEISGGKVRQCYALVEQNKELIKKEYNSTLITAASIHSPQSPIVARVAKEFGFKSIVGIGNTTVEKAVKENKALQYSEEFGAEVVLLSKTQAFNNVLYSRLNTLVEETPMFKILFGYHIESNKESIVDIIAEQVSNIPDEINTLVVNLGSAVSFVGIMTGILKYERDFRVIAIQPFGYDRRKFIQKSMNYMKWEYWDKFEYYMGSYPYSKVMIKEIDKDLELDGIYESKAYDLMLKENIVNPKKENVCFWVIGNTNFLR